MDIKLLLHDTSILPHSLQEAVPEPGHEGQPPHPPRLTASQAESLLIKPAFPPGFLPNHSPTFLFVRSERLYNVN